MQVRTRKLIGTVLLLIFLAVYVTAAVMIGANHVVAAPAWAEFAYFLAAGLLWVIPAALLIKWMQRPDPLKRR
ncbi:MAG TPA: DUF2842 domain-containing protein [Methyloceanibacter sp.]|jgi:regulator of protease activity HflC (stomatin/prohibitin superfamily)